MRNWMDRSLRSGFRRSSAALTSLRQTLMEKAEAEERPLHVQPHEYESVDVFHSIALSDDEDEDEDGAAPSFLASSPMRYTAFPDDDGAVGGNGVGGRRLLKSPRRGGSGGYERLGGSRRHSAALSSSSSSSSSSAAAASASTLISGSGGSGITRSTRRRRTRSDSSGGHRRGEADVHWHDGHGSDHDSDHDDRQRRRTRHGQGLASRLWTFLTLEQSWLFLMLLGFAGAMIILFSEWLLTSVVNLRDHIVFVLVGSPVLDFLVWMATAVLCAVVAAASVHIMSPHAAGSGIPAVKCILSGIVMNQYLSFRTFIAKLVGTTAAFGAGLSLGKEGPYVHLCAIVASQLASVSVFRRIRRAASVRLQMIAAGCAVGVATTFGAPLGGVMFSIEVTTTYYLIQNLWKGFFCAVSGSLFVRLIGSIGLTALFSTQFSALPFTSVELLAFSGLGVLCGFLSVAFIKLVQHMSTARRRYKVLVEWRYTQVVVVAALLAVLAFALPYLRNNYEVIIDDLFNEAAMEKVITKHVVFHLILLIVLKFVLTAMTIVLPIPCGLYTPVFVVGGALGRLVGELLAVHFKDVVPGGYAVVGAAAFAGGVTRTLSTTIVIFELTGQLHYMVPIMLAVLLSVAVANIWTDSVYDALLNDKGLPYMPPYTAKAGRERVQDVMDTNVPQVSRNATYNQLIEVLVSRRRTRSFALVDSAGHGTLQGKVSRDALLYMLRCRERLYEQRVEAQILNKALNTSPGDDRLGGGVGVDHGADGASFVWGSGEVEDEEATTDYRSWSSRHQAPAAAAAASPSTGKGEAAEAPNGGAPGAPVAPSRMRSSSPALRGSGRTVVSMLVEDARAMNAEDEDEAVLLRESERHQGVTAKKSMHDARAHEAPGGSTLLHDGGSEEDADGEDGRGDGGSGPAHAAASPLAAADSPPLLRRGRATSDARRPQATSSSSPVLSTPHGSSLATPPSAHPPLGRDNSLADRLHGAGAEHDLLDQEKWRFFERSIEHDLLMDYVDPCPFQMVAETPLSKAHFMFSMLSPRFAYITHNGRLVGYLTKERMASAIRDDELIASGRV